MNTAFKTVCTLLIFVLITALIWIFITYYNTTIEVTPNNKEYEIPVKDAQISEIISTESESGQTGKAGDVVIPSEETNTNPVILSSETDTSNLEKQQVLSEIDATLNELLEIVDKVPTVDETKLGVDNEEVQP